MFPTFATSRLREIQAAQRWNYVGARNVPVKFSLKMPDFHVAFRGYFTCRKSTTWYPQLYFPSERKGVLGDIIFFSPWKNLTASAGFEPREFWVLKASKLPIDHLRVYCTPSWNYNVKYPVYIAGGWTALPHCFIEALNQPHQRSSQLFLSQAKYYTWPDD
jgi:hypothetical protein